jgi:hypothetical protein
VVMSIGQQNLLPELALGLKMLCPTNLLIKLA